MALFNEVFEKPFGTLVNRLSLCFLDKDIESEYRSSGTSLEMLNSRSKWYFATLGTGTFIAYFLDVIAAVITSPYYSYSFSVWVLMGAIIPIIIIELICYKQEKLVNYRGVGFTLLGIPIQFVRNYGSFASETFYPFIGAE